MAIVLVDTANFPEAKDCFFLQTSLWVDERTQFFREVNSLINSNLSGFFFVSFHDISKTLDIPVILLEVVDINI